MPIFNEQAIIISRVDIPLWFKGIITEARKTGDGCMEEIDTVDGSEIIEYIHETIVAPNTCQALVKECCSPYHKRFTVRKAADGLAGRFWNIQT
jgi:hypothetical protein